MRSSLHLLCHNFHGKQSHLNVILISVLKAVVLSPHTSDSLEKIELTLENGYSTRIGTVVECYYWYR